jgi:hypothetical protein
VISGKGDYFLSTFIEYKVEYNSLEEEDVMINEAIMQIENYTKPVRLHLSNHKHHNRSKQNVKQRFNQISKKH